MVRDLYKCLLDDEEEFEGFDLKYVIAFTSQPSITYCLLCTHRKRYSDPANQAVVKRLVVEAKGMDGSVTATQVQGVHLVLQWNGCVKSMYCMTHDTVLYSGTL